MCIEMGDSVSITIKTTPTKKFNTEEPNILIEESSQHSPLNI